jgi:tetratricopeptide (TPR) repeat protein
MLSVVKLRRATIGRMPSFHRFLLLLSLTGISFGQATVPTQPAPPAQTSPAAPATASGSQLDPQAREHVVTALREKKFDVALSESKALLIANPGSAQANKLVGVVLLDMQKPSDALPYFQKALELDPNDPSVHSLLVQAYAASGDTKHRDEQRVILRSYHSDGKHPDISRSAGYMIESFPVGDKIVQAFEFYEPYGTFHLYYRFNVFNGDGHLERFLTLESDDADQAAYAKEHPKEAAAGERRFSLVSYRQNNVGQPTRDPISTIDGQPIYDDLRVRVIKALQEGSKPTAGTTAGTPAPPGAPK